MRYCPECEAEYWDEVKECADCQLPLIPAEEFHKRKEQEEQEKEILGKEEFVSVRVVENAFEADRIRATLEQEGVPVFIRTFEDTAYNGIYVSQKGWGYVEVPESEKERAERIVADLLHDFPEQEGNDDGDG